MSVCFDVGLSSYLMMNVVLLWFSVIAYISGLSAVSASGERAAVILVDCWHQRCCQFAPVDCITRLSGFLGLKLRYTTPDVRYSHRRYECDGKIKTLIFEDTGIFFQHNVG